MSPWREQVRRYARRFAHSLDMSEEHALAVVEGAHEAFVAIDEQGRILGWNPEAERVFGWSRKEALGRILAETIIPERFRTAHSDGLRRFLADGEGRAVNRLLELSALHRAGHEFPVELTISPQRVDGGWRFNAFVRDVTERRRAEDALREAEERFRAAFETAAIGMALVSPEGTFMQVNSALCEIVGYGEEELLAKTFQDITHPDDLEADLALVRQVLAGEIATYQMEKRYLHAHGRTVWILLSVSLVRDPGGEPLYFVSQIEDISARKRAQIELERSNQELGEFAYVASHDLNEPLRVISGFVQLLQRRYTGKLDQQADGFIDATVDGVERMQAIIDALLEYSRVGRANVGPELVDCDRAVDQARSSLERLLAEHNAELEVDELPTIEGEPALISQLFQNLIANAVKYGDPDHPRVHVSATRANGDWRFSVEDNGAGIDPEQRERAFEMFKRLHDREISGTGIGLAICKRIVEKHGGRIWVEPREVGGSVFRFTVPERAGQS